MQERVPTRTGSRRRYVGVGVVLSTKLIATERFAGQS